MRGQGADGGGSGGGGGRGRRGDGGARAPSSSRWTTSPCPPSCPSRRPWPIPRCASTSTATAPNVHKDGGAPVRRRGGGLRRRPTSSGRTSSSSRATRTCPWSSTRRWRSSARTASSRSGRPPRRRTTCTGCWPRSSTCPPAHIRVIAAPVGGGFGGKLDPFAHEIAACKLSEAHRPAGEDHAHARGGLLLPPRPAPRADVGQDGLHAGRRHHRDALPLLARRRRLRLLRRGLHLLHGRAPDRHLQDPRYKFEGARVFTNKPPCGPKRGPRHAPAPLRAGVPHRQGCRAAGPRSRRTCGGATSPSPSPRRRTRSR